MAAYSRPFRLFLTRQSESRIGTHRAPRSNGRVRWLTASQSWREEDSSKQYLNFDQMETELKDLRTRINSQTAREGRRDDGFGESTQEFRSRRELENIPAFKMPPLPKQKPGLLNMGETPEMDPAEDPEFEDDDISALAHGDLEQHREYRHYARLTAWEMPLLTKMAKPFVPPTEKEILRFRYTTYMGDEHPAEKKVVLEFCAEDMPDLTEIQQQKLKKLVGSRWNPKTNVIKMSSEMFENQAQNKRYLSDLVDTLLQEARDPVDTFEDIPLDTRHRPIKIKPRFPVEWRMTEERKAELEAYRQRLNYIEAENAVTDGIVDGFKQIKDALTRPNQSLEPELQPERVPARNTGRRKGLMR